MAQLQKSPYADVTADDINKTYRDGYITAQRRNQLMRGKAKSEVDALLGNEGYIKAIYEQTVKNVQENWDTLGQIAKTDPKDITAIDDAKNGARAAWAMIQISLAPLNALGTINGRKAEQIALSVGASPGLAKVIGVAADVGTGFLPVGFGVKTFVKGIQQAGELHKAKATIKLGQDLLKSAATDEPAVAAAIKAAEEASMKVFGRGLKQIPAGSKLVKGSNILARPLSQAGQVAAEQGVVIAGEKLIDDTIKEGLRVDGIDATALGTDKTLASTIPKDPRDEFMRALKQYKTEIDTITKTKPHAQTLAEASKLGIVLDDVAKLTPGKAINEAEMAAHLKALDPAVDALKEAAKGFQSGQVEGPQLGRMFEEFFTYSPKFRAAEVTAGRSVEILKETPPMKPLTDLMNSWDPESMAKLTPNQMWANLADDILALSKDGMKQLQVNGGGEMAKSGSKAWPMIREAYTNLLLARPVTQVRNFIGNTGAAAVSTMEREIGGWFSTQGPQAGRGVAQFNGMMAGIGDGLDGFAKAFTKSGVDDISKLDFRPHQIPGAIGRIINLPGDAMGGMDAFFKAILKRGSIHAQAVEEAAARGLTGLAKNDYIARRTIMPTTSMLENAKAFALEQTFQNDLGTIGKWAQGLAQTGPLALWFPFMKTPMNLVKYAWNRTPGLQLLSKSLYTDILAGGAKADMAIGRLTLSNLTGMFLFGLAQEGLLTGGGPSDPGLKRGWYGTKKPYSVMGPDGWYQYSNLDPGTTPMALIADYAEVMNQLDDPTAEQGAMAIGLSLTRDIADKSWWQTVGRVVDLVSSMRSGEEWGAKAVAAAASPIMSVLTFGPLGSATERIADPVSREARTFVDQLRARTPGYSQTLPPMRDGYGDPILPPQSLGSKWLSYAVPFTSAPYENDPIKKEGARLQVKLPQFPWSTGGGKMRDEFDISAPLPGEAVPVGLTPQQRDRWQVIYRNILRGDNGLSRLMADPQYQNGTFALQREMFSGFLSQARSAAKSALLVEDIPLAKKVVEASSGKYLPMLPPEQRPGVQAQITGQLDLLDELLPQQRDNLLKYGILDDGKARDEEMMGTPPPPTLDTSHPVTFVP